MNGKALLLVAGGLLALALSWLVMRPSAPPARERVVVRISHFRPSIPATMQKARGSLERKLAPLGVSVEWAEFKATTDSMLALASGAIDVSVGGVEGSLAAIASGVPLRIVATGPHQAPKTGWFTAILVRDDSPINSLPDLKGRKIAVGRGGFSEAVLAVAVRKGGARYPEDVQPIYLTTPDAAAAFTSGVVDAVLTLDPYIPHVLRTVHAHVLTDNEQLGYPTIWHVSVNEQFAARHPEIVDLLAAEFLAVGPWIAEHHTEAAASLAKVVGFDEALWSTTLGRASYTLEAPNKASLVDLQYVADQLLDLGVIRQPVVVADHLRQPVVTAAAVR
jgi:sulfonate transport system substrate-binding protein